MNSYCMLSVSVLSVNCPHVYINDFLNLFLHRAIMIAPDSSSNLMAVKYHRFYYFSTGVHYEYYEETRP
jgi:hypothetical protein